MTETEITNIRQGFWGKQKKLYVSRWYSKAVTRYIT